MRVAGSRWLLWTLMGTLLLALLVPIAGCGGDDETTTTAAPTTTAPAPTTTAASPPAPPTDGGATATTAGPTFTGDEALIADNWTKLFDGSLPAADKAALLENGDQYTKEIEAQAASPITKAATAAVSAVTMTSDTTADVIYSLLLSGQVALPDQKGQAVLQDGVWKVSAQTFLALAALQGGAPAPSSTP